MIRLDDQRGHAAQVSPPALLDANEYAFLIMPHDPASQIRHVQVKRGQATGHLDRKEVIW